MIQGIVTWLVLYVKLQLLTLRKKATKYFLRTGSDFVLPVLSGELLPLLKGRFFHASVKASASMVLLKLSDLRVKFQFSFLRSGISASPGQSLAIPPLAVPRRQNTPGLLGLLIQQGGKVSWRRIQHNAHRQSSNIYTTYQLGVLLAEGQPPQNI